MIGILLATHGDFALGIQQSVTMVLGEQPNLKSVVLRPEEGPEDIRRKMEEAVKSFDDPDQVLILVDLWGGTPFNQANGFLSGKEDKWAIISGLNMPMLVEACIMRDTVETAQELAVQIVKSGRDGIKILPETLEIKRKEVSAKKVHTIPEGTVIGNGKIEYVLARVDSRLLHGQVATSWTKTMKPHRIIVVSDFVAKDDLRKKMIQEAAPPGVKTNVVPLRKMVQVDKDTRFGDTKAMLLFETPQEALKAIQSGVTITELNIGSMAHSKGKVVVNKAISMDLKDVETYEELLKLGISMDVRKVPSDTKENINEMLKKAKRELKK